MEEVYGMQTLLLQVLIVLFPAFIFQEYWMRKKVTVGNPHASWKIVAPFSLMSLILSMSFPVQGGNGYIFSLQFVPVIVAFVYGGLYSGILTTSGLVMYRFFLPSGGTILTFVCLSLVVFACLYFRHKYPVYDRVIIKRYFMIVIFITSCVDITQSVVVNVVSDMTWDEVLFLASYPIISVLSVYAVINFLENTKERLLMEQEVQRAERLNVIGHLAASVAHEVRNPMTVVRGFMQLFHRETYIPEQKKEYLRLMIRELDRAETIINDYLTLARPKLETQEIIDIREQVDFVLEAVSSFSLLNNVNVEKDLDYRSFKVSGYKEKLSQVLINLIKNAIEASKPGESVIISTYSEHDYVKINVKDHGVGMTKEQLKKIGTPFYTTKENGTGLGLAVCYRIIESMDGKIRIESKEGEGTSITIELPLYKESSSS